MPRFLTGHFFVNYFQLNKITFEYHLAFVH